MSGDPSGPVRRRFVWLVVLTAVPLLIALALLGMREMRAARSAVLAELTEAQRLRLDLLRQLATDVDTHTSVMRALIEQSLDPATKPAPPYEGKVDWPPVDDDPGPERGMILGNPAVLDQPTRQEIAAVWPIFALARATHATRPWLRWSYFFSDTRRYVAIYPWATPGQMMDPAHADASFAGYFDYALYTMGLPAQNAGRAADWSPVYVDAGGAGLMVTHAAPVWVAGRFRGVVGTDVLLDHPSRLLAALPTVGARVLVVDQDGNLVATPDASAAAAPTPTAAATLIGDLDLSATGGQFVQRGAWLVSSQQVPGTPWRLVMLMQAAAVQGQALDRVSFFGLLIVGVVLAMTAVAYIVDRHFVGPAVALADYGTLPSAEIMRIGPPANLPGPFRPLIERITEAARLRFAQVSQLRAMVDGVPLRVAYLDADLIYRDANREFLTFIAKTRDEVIGRHVRDVLGPVIEARYHAFAADIARGEVARFDGWIDYRGHGRRFLQVAAVPFTPPGETRPGYLTFSRDLTELKTAESAAEAQRAELAEREGLFRSVVTSALDAIVVMDDQGLVREFNPAAEAIFGHSAAEAIGQSVAELIVPPEARAAHAAGMARFVATGEARVVGRRIEVEAQRKDGSRLPVELAITEARASGHRLFVSHLRDLTEAKRQDQEMRDGRERLHQVEKLSAMGSLLAGVAHELNNPLAIAVAQATLLAERAQDPDVRTRAERIRAAADRCGRIVKSFLAMARQKPPRREPMDVAEALRTALEVVGYGLRSAGVEVTLDLPDLPPVMGDRDLLGQVFSNLFINAQQALITRPLPRRIHVTGRAEAGQIRLTVADNGPGVPAAIRARIFEPYFTTKAVEVGTGIGLSISRNVIEGHGGTITLGDAADGGAAFVIALPIAGPATEAEPAAALARAARLRILVVDDEPDVAESLAEVLESDGHQVTRRGSAETALATLAEGGFDAVFTDLRMPGMDGADLALAIRRDHPGLAGRVVVLTGDSVAGPAHLEAKGVGETLMLDKPFLPDEVRGLTRDLARQARPPDPVPPEPAFTSGLQPDVEDPTKIPVRTEM